MAESIGERYMVESRYENMGDSAQSRGEPQPPLELPWEEDAELIALPAPADIHLPERSLRRMIEQRKTVRTYSDQPLSLEELAWPALVHPGCQSENGSTCAFTHGSLGWRAAPLGNLPAGE